MVDGVGERTGGVPLFVEEVTRLLLERGAGGGVQTIPPTLQQSLAARLDRLGEAREVAQIGAVLGRDFSYPLLDAVAGFEPGRLQAALDRLAESDLLIVEGAPPSASYRFKHALIRDAAYDSLLKSRRQALHRRAADVLVTADAEPEAVAHHFTEAGLDDLAIEWWGKAGDQALRRSAFQEAIAHLGKAIAMADKAESGKTVGGMGQQRQLHVAYGNALIAARGYGAPETTEAFARARDSASGDKDAPERLAADYGLWVGSLWRADLPSMRAHAAAFLSDVEARPDSPEAGVAHRAAGATCWFAGEYREARDHFERALALFQPGRDDDLVFRFGADAGVGAMGFLAIASWPLGEVDRAISFNDRMQTRMADLTHVGALAVGRMFEAMFELMRGDHARAAANAFELVRLARQYDMSLYLAYGVFLEGWATAASGATGDGLERMRRGVELLRKQNVLLFDGLLKIALADAEARAGDPVRAVAILDEALATCDRLGFRAFEAELHRARGEILLKRDPANLAPAEAAFVTAIAVAKQQGTRSFELRAALSLAKLYQLTARRADAHTVLTPALEGFAPTPEMPEIAEAEALLAELAEKDEIKSVIAQRQRRRDLQRSYGQALLWGRGFADEEATAALARVREFGWPDENATARFVAYGSQCLRSFMRGEYRQARDTAETFLREAEAHGHATEAGSARRMLGLVCLYQGDLKLAQSVLDQALADYVPERDGDTRFPAGEVEAAAFLALTEWHLGRIERARQLIQQAIRRADELAHVATVANALFFDAALESRRNDVSATRLAADNLVGLSQEYGIKAYADVGQVFANWARGRLAEPEEGASGLERALAAYIAQGNRADTPSFYGLLSELEAATQGPASALARIAQGLTIAEETGERFTDPYLHRLRGDILLRRDPANPARAEEAFQTAISIAKQQGARSYGLLASLSLAKLYQSSGRLSDAYTALVPALEGFTPTPEMPEIAEAQELLAEIAQ